MTSHTISLSGKKNLHKIDVKKSGTVENGKDLAAILRRRFISMNPSDSDD